MIEVAVKAPREITSLTEIEQFIREEEQKQLEREKQFKDALQKHKSLMAEAERVKQTILAEFDMYRINRAREIVFTEGLNKNFEPTLGDGSEFFDKIVSDVLNDFRDLRGRYFGLKNYERFINQASDHFYGYGPKHGNIVVRVGLNSYYREHTDGISTEDKDSVLYYFELLRHDDNRPKILMENE